MDQAVLEVQKVEFPGLPFLHQDPSYFRGLSSWKLFNQDLSRLSGSAHLDLVSLRGTYVPVYIYPQKNKDERYCAKSALLRGMQKVKAVIRDESRVVNHFSQKVKRVFSSPKNNCELFLGNSGI